MPTRGGLFLKFLSNTQFLFCLSLPPAPLEVLEVWHMHKLSASATTLWWLETVSITFQDLDFDAYHHTLSIDATGMVSRNCPIIGEHVGIIFMTQ